MKVVPKPWLEVKGGDVKKQAEPAKPFAFGIETEGIDEDMTLEIVAVDPTGVEEIVKVTRENDDVFGKFTPNRDGAWKVFVRAKDKGKVVAETSFEVEVKSLSFL